MSMWENINTRDNSKRFGCLGTYREFFCARQRYGKINSEVPFPEMEMINLSFPLSGN